MKQEVYKRLNEIFQDIFDDEALKLTDNMTAEDIPGWDSLIHVNILVAIEREFHIEFNMNEANRMVCIGEMVNEICRKMGQQ